MREVWPKLSVAELEAPRVAETFSALVGPASFDEQLSNIF